MFGFFDLILFPFFMAIAAIIGFVLARSIWFVYLAYGPFPPRPPRNHGMALSIGLLSMLLVMSLYAWLLIYMEAGMTLPPSPDHTDQIVLEAWRRSMIPPPFQTSCKSVEEIVCQRANEFWLRLWDAELYTDDSPWLAGLLAGITSTITVMYLSRAMRQQSNSIAVDSTS